MDIQAQAAYNQSADKYIIWPNLKNKCFALLCVLGLNNSLSLKCSAAVEFGSSDIWKKSQNIA